MASARGIFFDKVDEERLDDGTIRSLWATKAGSYRSSCFYLDVEKSGGFVNGYAGCGGGPEKRVSLGGNAAELVGDVGAWPAAKARLDTVEAQAVVPVVDRYFLVPDRLVKTGAKSFTVTLLDDSDNALTEETIQPPA